MADILEEIVAWKRVELKAQKERLSEKDIHRKIDGLFASEAFLGSSVTSMRRAIATSATGIIAEFKRKSPSKGWINEEAKAEEVPISYERNGASAVSILTDDKYFGGCDDFVTKARMSGLSLPVLYKNFIIDEYQLFQARLCGASAALLIAATLSKEEFGKLNDRAHELGMETLLETHCEAETEYADYEPDLCGVNNRNLGTFVTDVENSFRLVSYLPKDAVKVSESGIGNAQTIKRLQTAGYNGFLVGESFMKTADPGNALRTFINELT